MRPVKLNCPLGSRPGWALSIYIVESRISTIATAIMAWANLPHKGTPKRRRKLEGTHMGVSVNRRPEYSTLNSRIPIIRTPKQGTPNFPKLSYNNIGTEDPLGEGS